MPKQEFIDRAKDFFIHMNVEVSDAVIIGIATEFESIYDDGKIDGFKEATEDESL